jgi:hypothetical protein
MKVKNILINGLVSWENATKKAEKKSMAYLSSLCMVKAAA